MYVLYIDDSLFAGPNKDKIDQVLKDLKRVNLNVTDEGDIQDYLGINISKKKDAGTIHLLQPHFIDQILKDLKIQNDDVKLKDIPAMSSMML
jgi:hypothetical protein